MPSPLMRSDPQEPLKIDVEVGEIEKARGKIEIQGAQPAAIQRWRQQGGLGSQCQSREHPTNWFELQLQPS